MLKVGLTGGIGSGKSTVANMFALKNIPVIDADKISREIYEIYPEIYIKIRREFGSEYFDEQGNLKRRELGNLIFKDRRLRTKLEDITLTYIIGDIFKRAEQYNKAGAKICIIDAPTLIEVQLHKFMELNVLVWVDLDTQIRRVARRDSMVYEDILNRIKSQMPIDEKIKLVDFVIDNSKSLQYTKEQFEAVLTKLYDYEVQK